MVLLLLTGVAKYTLPTKSLLVFARLIELFPVTTTLVVPVICEFTVNPPPEQTKYRLPLPDWILPPAATEAPIVIRLPAAIRPPALDCQRIAGAGVEGQGDGCAHGPQGPQGRRYRLGRGVVRIHRIAKSRRGGV